MAKIVVLFSKGTKGVSVKTDYASFFRRALSPSPITDTNLFYAETNPILSDSVHAWLKGNGHCRVEVLTHFPDHWKTPIAPDEKNGRLQIGDVILAVGESRRVEVNGKIRCRVIPSA